MTDKPDDKPKTREFDMRTAAGRFGYEMSRGDGAPAFDVAVSREGTILMYFRGNTWGVEADVAMAEALISALQKAVQIAKEMA